MITFGIYISDGLLTLRNFERDGLRKILSWYNSSGLYRYATGIEGDITLGELEAQFDAINGSDREFFLGIYRQPDKRLIGVITGSLVQRTLWIKLLAIAAEYMRWGYGTAATELLLDHFGKMGYASDCCLSVIEKNDAGRSFWIKNGFTDLKKLRKHQLFEGIEHDIIIMHKVI